MVNPVFVGHNIKKSLSTNIHTKTRLTIFAHIYKTYRVELRAQANFSAPTFEPAHGACAGQCAALSVQSSQMQLRCSTSISSPQASSLRSERSAKRAVENVIAFCPADRTLSSKSLANYFQCKKRKSQVVRRLQKKRKKQLDQPAEGVHVRLDRSSISSASVAAGLFPNLSCLVSLNL